MAPERPISGRDRNTLEGEPTVSLFSVVQQLSDLYGPLPDPSSKDPFELILWENVAYLADDTRRSEAMSLLRKTVGTSPRAIAEAAPEQLAGAAGLGILPESSVGKLQKAAKIALGEFDGDLAGILALPADQAKRALRRFPGIGEPSAEKILLFCRSQPFLAADSNALRVLVRFGFCPAGETYASTYAVARRVAQEDLGDDFDLLISARQLLRRHGQVVCRRGTPLCERCLLRSECGFGSK